MKETGSLIKPKPQVSFSKYERGCPWHTKSRCGRAFCSHERNNKERCNKWSCPFYRDYGNIKKGIKIKSEYRPDRRFRKVML